jgi:hypothetical protein
VRQGQAVKNQAAMVQPVLAPIGLENRAAAALGTRLVVQIRDALARGETWSVEVESCLVPTAVQHPWKSDRSPAMFDANPARRVGHVHIGSRTHMAWDLRWMTVRTRTDVMQPEGSNTRGASQLLRQASRQIELSPTTEPRRKCLLRVDTKLDRESADRR